MTGKKLLLNVTMAVEPGTSQEVDVIRWLSMNLSSEEWLRVRSVIGMPGLLRLPVRVLGLPMRANMIVTEVHRVQTLADLVRLSRTMLQQKVHHTTYVAIIRKVELFGLDLCA